GKIARMVAVGLVVGIPVHAGAQERIVRVARFTYTELVDVEAVGPDGVHARRCRPVRGQALDLHGDQGAFVQPVEADAARKLRGQGAGDELAGGFQAPLGPSPIIGAPAGTAA